MYDKKKSGILIGKKAISAHLNNMSDYHLKRWIEKGMPVLIKDGRWLAHEKNIEDFFMHYTRRKANLDE